MSELPLLSGKEVIKVLTKLGYYEARQRGSHIRLCCDGRKPTTIPDHKIIGPGLLRKVLRDIKLSPEDFIKLYTSE